MQAEFPDLSLPQRAAGESDQDRDRDAVEGRPLYEGGFRNKDERLIFSYHQKALHKGRTAHACATRCLIAWVQRGNPRPQKPEDIMAAVEDVLKRPRAYGVFVRPWEVRAVAFVHALHRPQKRKQENAKKQGPTVDQIDQGVENLTRAPEEIVGL